MFVPVQSDPQAPQFPWSICVFTHAAVLPLPQRFGKVGLGHVATQAPLLQVSVPLRGCAGHVTQAVPHCIVPGAQLLQTPPLQWVPVRQTLPHVPQWFGSFAVSTSQPLAAL